jgi:hypothetical protein
MRHDAYRAKLQSDLSSIAAKRADLDTREARILAELERITQDEQRATQYPTLAGPFVVCKDNPRHTPDYLSASYQYEAEAQATPRIFKQAKRANDAALATGGYVMTAPVWALKQAR